MNIKEMKDTINYMMYDDYKSFVQALISIEKGIKNQEILDSIYEKFMRNNNMNILNNEFENMIKNKETHEIKENRKEIELTEYKGNIVSDVNIKEMDGKYGKFKVANFSIGLTNEKGKTQFINFSAYGEKTKLVENMKKGDFVKISGEKIYSKDEKGNEYLNVKVFNSTILKKQQEKNIENKKESTLGMISKFKKQIIDKKKETNKQINKSRQKLDFSSF